MRKVLLILGVTFGLIACQTTTTSMTSSPSSRIASAVATPQGVTVVTQRGNRNTFNLSEVCQGQTWMTVGDNGPSRERFFLSQRGRTVFVGGVPIAGLSCPVRTHSGGGGGGGSSSSYVDGWGNSSAVDSGGNVNMAPGETMTDHPSTSPSDSGFQGDGPPSIDG